MAIGRVTHHRCNDQCRNCCDGAMSNAVFHCTYCVSHSTSTSYFVAAEIYIISLAVNVVGRGALGHRSVFILYSVDSLENIVSCHKNKYIDFAIFVNIL